MTKLSPPIGWYFKIVWMSILQLLCNLPNPPKNPSWITITYTVTQLWNMTSCIHPRYKSNALLIHFTDWSLLDIWAQGHAKRVINGSTTTWKLPYSIQTFFFFYQWFGCGVEEMTIKWHKPQGRSKPEVKVERSGNKRI